MTEDTPDTASRDDAGSPPKPAAAPPKPAPAAPAPQPAPAATEKPKDEPVEVIGADPPGTGAPLPATDEPAAAPAAAHPPEPVPAPAPAPAPRPPATRQTGPRPGAAAEVPTYLNLPNLLTGLRFALVFVILILLLWPWGPFLTGALILFAVAAATDWLDGKVARVFHMETDLGRMMDHIADKLLVGITMLAMCANGTIDGINVLAAAIILAREIAVSGLREHLGAKGITVPSSLFAKWKTTFQLVALAALMAAPLAPITDVARVAGLLILWVAMAMTLISGIQYVMATRDAWEEP